MTSASASADVGWQVTWSGLPVTSQATESSVGASSQRPVISRAAQARGQKTILVEGA